VVRLAVASLLQQLPKDERSPFLEILTQHAEDAGDHNLPLMYWYAAEPIAAADPEEALALGLSCGKTIPLVRDFMLRRLAAMNSPESLASLVSALHSSVDPDEQLAILQGIRKGLEGRRRAAPPDNWAGVYSKIMASPNAAVRNEATALGVTFGDAAAMERMRATCIARDARPKTPTSRRLCTNCWATRRCAMLRSSASLPTTIQRRRSCSWRAIRNGRRPNDAPPSRPSRRAPPLQSPC
jgi:hypothetical protein